MVQKSIHAKRQPRTTFFKAPNISRNQEVDTSGIDVAGAALGDGAIRPSKKPEASPSPVGDGASRSSKRDIAMGRMGGGAYATNASTPIDGTETVWHWTETHFPKKRDGVRNKLV